jgi:transposase
MPGKAAKVVVTEKQQVILREFAASRSVSSCLAKRSRIILLAFDGLNNETIQDEVGLGHDQVGLWRRRWRDDWDRLIAIECVEELHELKNAIKKLLADTHRSGRPARISSNEQTDLIAKACENPQNSGRPIARWTSDELAHEMTTSGAIAKISGRWVRRLLARAKIRPHRIQYWLFSKDKKRDPRFARRVVALCDAYRESVSLYEQEGVHTICLDEMTGIQALERIAPDLPVAPGLIARLEYEYRRHATIGLFGNFHVATGKLWCPMLRETRTEEDTLENLDNIISQDPTARFRLVMDNLNTHVSESFVRYIAEVIGHEDDLGKKGVRGILKSVASRSKFLSDPSHRIQFLFTPRHCSWLNQIELWFGTLRRKVTRTMSFDSLESLSESILRFIEYYNAHLAHPYNWTYTGRVLAD